MANAVTLIKCAYQPTDPIESNINVLDLTNGSIRKNADNEYYWDGPVILDKLLNVLGQNLKTQLDNGWIEGSDYANAYVKMMEIATVQAMAWIKMSKDIAAQNRQLDQVDNKNALDACLQNNKLAIENADVGAKIALSERQVEGYDDNITIKLLQTELDAFALIYSSGMLDNPDLGPLKSSELTNCYNTLKNRISKKVRVTQGA